MKQNGIEKYLRLIQTFISGQPAIGTYYLAGRLSLDLGCGHGEILAVDRNNIVGLDLNLTILKALRPRGHNVVCATVESLPFKDASFEVVNCDYVIEHLMPHAAFRMICEANRVLRESGVFIIRSHMAVPRVWEGFSHVRPYPPIAIKKLLFKNVEWYLGDCSAKDLYLLRVEKVYYYGRYYRNRVLNLVLRLVANLLPIGRRDYVMIMHKGRSS